MSRIWVMNGRAFKFYIVAMIAALFAAVYLISGTPLLPVQSSGEEPAAFQQADIDEKKVALTFNISWGETRAEPILNILKEHEIDNAAFFISAAWAERHPEIAQHIKEDGHTIGNHGYQYKHYPEWEENEMIQDLNLSHKKIKEVTEVEPEYFRPPHGDFDKRVLDVVDRFGYETIHWSVGGSDWRNPGVQAIVSEITDEVSAGDVILLHASDSAKQTHEALPKILSYLNENGYDIVSIDELMTNTEAEAEEVY